MKGKFGVEYGWCVQDIAAGTRGPMPVVKPIARAGEGGTAPCTEEGIIKYGGLTEKGKNLIPCAQRCIEFHEMLHEADDALQAACDTYRKAERKFHAQEIRLRGRIEPHESTSDRGKEIREAESAWAAAQEAFQKAMHESDCRAWLETITCFKKMNCFYEQEGMKDRRDKECPGAGGWVMSSLAHAREYCTSKSDRDRVREKKREDVH